MIKSEKHVPASTVDALSHDINTDAEFRVNKWRQLRLRKPAVCDFITIRLLEALDENSAKLALQVIVEADEIEARLEFADTMVLRHGFDPALLDLAGLSIEDQQKALQITPYTDELAG